MRLIGLTGKAGSGKDTVAGLIEEQIRGAWGYAFADPIREMLDSLLIALGEYEGDWDDRAWKERNIAALEKSPRRLAQTLGTEWGRQLIHPDIWLRGAAAFVEKAEGYGDQVKCIVVTDCRFENEASWIRGQGGEIWHILRPQITPVAGHASEAGIGILAGHDSILDNSGDFGHLAEQVKRALAGELVVTSPLTPRASPGT